MEFIIEVLLELFGELLLQVVMQALAEAGLHAVRRPGERPPPSPWLLVLGYGLLGLVVGGLSLLLFPHSLLHSRPARLVGLGLTPVASGLAMALLGAWRLRRGQPQLAMDRFAYGYLFALVVALVRFSWAQ
jgi:hypothetical protein